MALLEKSEVEHALALLKKKLLGAKSVNEILLDLDACLIVFAILSIQSVLHALFQNKL